MSRTRTVHLRSPVVVLLVGLVALAGPAAAQQTRVFVTSSLHTGELDGLGGADTICQALGATVDPGATWIALLSTSTVDARDRITTTGPFVRVGSPGFIIANDVADLFDGTLDLAVRCIENGICLVFGGDEVWTGSLPGGTLLPAQDACDDWTSATATVPHPNHFGTYGLKDESGGAWIAEGGRNCDLPARLYCFEAASGLPTTPPIALALLATIMLAAGLYLMRRHQAFG